MASTTFVDGVTPIVAAWLNDVNRMTYGNYVDVRTYGAVGDGVTDCTVAIQNAINDIANGVVKGVLYFPSGIYVITDTLITPSTLQVQGSGTYSWLREFGDTTGGQPHPARNATLIITKGAGTARRWTDVDGLDANIRPAIVLLGENQTWKDLTIQTGANGEPVWDTGLHIAGTSKHRFLNVDVRGGWTKAGHYWDATWSYLNTTLMTLPQLPSWHNAARYDYGLTDTRFINCNVSGIRAVDVQGSTRVVGSPWAYAPNGISDSGYAYCAFYNEGDQATRATSGALLHYDYKVEAIGTPSQGMFFHSCRWDVASLWWVDLDYCSDITIGGGRTFCETSAAWLAYQIGQGAPVEAQRGRLRTTANTGVVNVINNGEIFANIAPLGVGNTRLRDFQYRYTNGSRIVYHGTDGHTDAVLRTDYETGAYPVQITSGAANGGINLTSLQGNVLNTYISFNTNQANFRAVADLDWDAVSVRLRRNATTFLNYNGTSFFLPTVPGDTTANPSNVEINSANGNVRRSTSAAKYKDVQGVISEDIRNKALQLDGVVYKSLCSGDDPDQLHLGIVADQADALGLQSLVTYNGTEVEGFKYERLVAVLLEEVKALRAEVNELKNG